MIWDKKCLIKKMHANVWVLIFLFLNAAPPCGFWQNSFAKMRVNVRMTIKGMKKENRKSMNIHFFSVCVQGCASTVLAISYDTAQVGCTFFVTANQQNLVSTCNISTSDIGIPGQFWLYNAYMYAFTLNLMLQQQEYYAPYLTDAFCVAYLTFEYCMFVFVEQGVSWKKQAKSSVANDQDACAVHEF